MRRFSQHLLSAVFAIALVTPAIITGCAARVGVGYRVYDPGYGDYHVWDDNEAGFLHAGWEGESSSSARRHPESARPPNRKSILRGVTASTREPRVGASSRTT